MHKPVSKAQAQQYVGKTIVAYKKDGSVVTGKLVRIAGNRLYVQTRSGKKVKTKALAPLVLFDLLAIGTAPYAYGYGYPGAFGGYPGGFGYGPGVGFPYGAGGFFW
ncbi:MULTISPECIES: hypothetical protein [Paenibacillus]|uniref:50S ribosomal protein L33 n=1 Tax=Paenibacillus campinasensis TaxID=66347 RepID=A0A268EDN2_9BACL|nr:MULTISPECIES: hypothetical protein [Paenibacillus]MUG66047.1 hypothetical protein [Paenibacillus campinasensis]PAD71231.1 hypothetical protein CHH67_25250 [Paenibacillus campinasensis]PAK49810.1 hypothetical protein CHH75_19730 [Paenibacillus sp. 7541]